MRSEGGLVAPHLSDERPTAPLKMVKRNHMGDSYTERAQTADALARNARNDRERQAFEEIALIWRRLASGERPVTAPEERTFEPR